MKLIDDKLVEEKALKYSIDANTDRLQQIEDNDCYDFEEYISEAVKGGVDFAEQQLKQKMIEFIDWYFENLTELEFKGLETTEQFLEEFINQQK